MSSGDERAYRRFLLDRASDLRRIAHDCRGDAELGDVQNQAWLVALEVRDRRGHPVAFDDPTDQDLLLRYLYSRLVKFAEKTQRYAQRLDRRRLGPDGDEKPSLLDNLSATELSDPMLGLLHLEDARAAPPPRWHQTEADAYVYLLVHRFDRQMPRLARYLRISTAHCYVRRAAARLRLCQRPLPLENSERSPESSLRAWRRYKLYRDPEQLSLPFGGDRLI